MLYQTNTLKTIKLKFDGFCYYIGMNISNVISTTVEDLFQHFDYKINPLAVSRARLIAYECTVNSNTHDVYEIVIEGNPRYFGTAGVEYVRNIEDEVAYMTSWTRPKGIKLLEHHSEGSESIFLYELDSPFLDNKFTR